jgi:tRNA A37 N6-isopentenylltransferase MiaA
MHERAENEYPLVVVAGPTASGKTALAMKLAEELDGEIISCDSVAVYRLMEIGTAKPRIEERERVQHHCIDLYWPDEACTAGDYARLDPRAAELIHANDLPKLIRSIEVTFGARQPQTEQWQAGRDPLRGYRVLEMGLAPERERLYARINERAAGMFERGLVAETKMLRERYGDDCRALGALGYAQAMSVLRGELMVDEAVAAAQQGHRNYAKRQATWFRRDTGMTWLKGFGDEAAVQDEASKLVKAHVGGMAE